MRLEANNFDMHVVGPDRRVPCTYPNRGRRRLGPSSRQLLFCLARLNRQRVALAVRALAARAQRSSGSTNFVLGTSVTGRQALCDLHGVDTRVTCRAHGRPPWPRTAQHRAITFDSESSGTTLVHLCEDGLPPRPGVREAQLVHQFRALPGHGSLTALGSTCAGLFLRSPDGVPAAENRGPRAQCRRSIGKIWRALPGACDPRLKTRELPLPGGRSLKDRSSLRANQVAGSRGGKQACQHARRARTAGETTLVWRPCRNRRPPVPPLPKISRGRIF